MSEDVTAAVLAQDDRRRRALEAHDAATLGEIFTEDFTYTHAAGKRDDRATFLAMVTDGPARFISMERSDTVVRSHGDLAIMEGNAAMTFQLKAETEPRTRVALFTSVWVRKAGTWRLAAQVNVPAPGT